MVAGHVPFAIVGLCLPQTQLCAFPRYSAKQIHTYPEIRCRPLCKPPGRARGGKGLVHLASFAFVVSIVTYPNFLGCPSPSSLPNPSRDLILPNEPSFCDRSAGVIAGVRPETCRRLTITSSDIGGNCRNYVQRLLRTILE
jgi:hypothetical protein